MSSCDSFARHKFFFLVCVCDVSSSYPPLMDWAAAIPAKHDPSVAEVCSLSSLPLSLSLSLTTIPPFLSLVCEDTRTCGNETATHC